MAKKRFTDIEIWDREWYMELSPKHKCLIKYIFDKCDVSGCWKPNWKLATIHIGETVVASDLFLLPQDQYEVLDSGKIFIPDFINFQYGRLSKECKPHAQIISVLEKNDILDRFIDFIDESGRSVKALRKRLTDNAKREIYEDDDYQCQYCGSRPGKDLLIIDHIIALSKGGDNSPDNLTTSCKSCNSKKHDDDVLEFVNKHGFIPLNNLNKKLDRVFKGWQTLQEKEKDKEIEMEKDKEMEKKGGSGENKIQNKFVCYDAEDFILKNRVEFERICIATGKPEDFAKKELRKFHLWMQKREQYPIGNLPVIASFETWLLNEDKFKLNGLNGTKGSTQSQRSTTSGTIIIPTDKKYR